MEVKKKVGSKKNVGSEMKSWKLKRKLEVKEKSGKGNKKLGVKRIFGSEKNSWK